MEQLYAKLYDKYTSVKNQQLTMLEEINEDQECKFVNYVNVAEEMMQCMKDENDRLRAEVADLRAEVATIRSAKDDERLEFQKQLMEEIHKNKELLEKVEKLEIQLQKELSCSSKLGQNDNKQLNLLENAQVTPGGSTRRKTRKRRQEAAAEIVKDSSTYGVSDQDADDIVVRRSKRFCEGNMSNGDISNNRQPECCARNADRSGDRAVASDHDLSSCQFQSLIECLVGLKLSTIHQTEGICVSALHQSSGYSFSLTWIRKAAGEEPELLYRVSTLGTFERIAPEWMRSVLMFSMSMCPLFFERVTRVIKLHH